MNDTAVPDVAIIVTILCLKKSRFKSLQWFLYIAVFIVYIDTYTFCE